MSHGAIAIARSMLDLKLENTSVALMTFMVSNPTKMLVNVKISTTIYIFISRTSHPSGNCEYRSI